MAPFEGFCHPRANKPREEIKRHHMRYIINVEKLRSCDTFCSRIFLIWFFLYGLNSYLFCIIISYFLCTYFLITEQKYFGFFTNFWNLTSTSWINKPIPGMFVLIWMHFSWWFHIIVMKLDTEQSFSMFRDDMFLKRSYFGVNMR